MVFYRVVGLQGDHKVCRDQPGALVNQLVIGVLAVGAYAAPQDRTGCKINRGAVLGYPLAVTFHVQLLQVFRQVLQVFVVGQHRVAAGTPEIVVPHAEHGHHYRQVALGRGCAEVAVHGVGAGQQGPELRHAQGQRDGQADGRPERVAPANPVPHGEDVLGSDAEAGGGFYVGGDRQEVAGDGGVSGAVVQEPLASNQAVVERFLGAERFGLHQEQCSFRGQCLQGFSDIGAVDIGHKVTVKIALPVRFQGFDHQFGAQKGAADANAHYIGKALTGVTAVLASLHRLNQPLHARQCAVHLWHDVAAVYFYCGVCRLAQGGVQGRAVLGDVHNTAAEQGFGAVLQAAAEGQVGQCLQGIVCEPVPGEIQGQAGGFNQVPGGPPGVVPEQVAHGPPGQGIFVLDQGLPLGGACQWSRVVWHQSILSVCRRPCSGGRQLRGSAGYGNVVDQPCGAQEGGYQQGELAVGLCCRFKGQAVHNIKVIRTQAGPVDA